MITQSCADQHLRYPASIVRNKALIDSIAGLSAAETKGFAEIESFAPYHQMPAFLAGFENYVDGVRVAFGSSDATAQAYDRGLMAASLCQRLGGEWVTDATGLIDTNTRTGEMRA